MKARNANTVWLTREDALERWPMSNASGNGSIPDRAKGCAQESIGDAEKAEAGSPRVAARGALAARPLAEYHEDFGPVVWWKFPVNEPSWIGQPSDDSWPGYHTHWTPHPPVPAVCDHRGFWTHDERGNGYCLKCDYRGALRRPAEPQ
jgi:hypothetical protein